MTEKTEFNREIKFRAWSKTKKSMQYKVLVGNNDENDKNYISPQIYVENKGWVNADKYCIEIMQYTGLKDKNGNLIYEGDFVKWLECKYVITWINDEACFKVISVDGSITTTLNLHEHCEIIGNIFENPELLNE